MTTNPELLETIVEDLAAERRHLDMLGAPRVRRRRARPLRRAAVRPLRQASPLRALRDERPCFVWHHCWDPHTRYHDVNECPNANETVDGAWQACNPPDEDK